MAYDAQLVARVAAHLADRGRETRQMMGSFVFMVDGHMCCGVSRDRLMVRLGPDADAACMDTDVHVLEIGSRRAYDFVTVAPGLVSTDASLANWIGRGLATVSTLPSKRHASPSAEDQRGEI